MATERRAGDFSPPIEMDSKLCFPHGYCRLLIKSAWRLEIRPRNGAAPASGAIAIYVSRELISGGVGGGDLHPAKGSPAGRPSNPPDSLFTAMSRAHQDVRRGQAPIAVNFKNRRAQRVCLRIRPEGSLDVWVTRGLLEAARVEGAAALGTPT